MSDKLVPEESTGERPHLQTAVFKRFFDLMAQDETITPESLEAVKHAVAFDRRDRKAVLEMVRNKGGNPDGAVDHTDD